MKISQYPRSADGNPLNLNVAVLTDASGNNGARLTNPPIGPDNAPIDQFGMVIVDQNGDFVDFGGVKATAESAAAEATATSRNLRYGDVIKALKTTGREVRQDLDVLHTRIVGKAKELGVNGGFGGARFPVVYGGDITDASKEYSIGWAIAQAKALGTPCQIWVVPGVPTVNCFVMGQFTMDMDDFTIHAPGGNCIFWFDRLYGNIDWQATNWILSGIDHRMLPGPINETVLDDVSNVASVTVNVRNDLNDKFAVMNCEFERPSWQCLDVTANAPVPPNCRFTFQDCIFRNAIQSHLLGTNNSGFAPGDYTNDASPRLTVGTIYNCIYDCCLQRNPKVLGHGYIHLVDCFWQLAPYKREYATAGAEIHTDAYGVGVQEGGWAWLDCCLFTSVDPLVDGKDGTQLEVGGYSGNTGRIKVVNCVAENGIVLNERNPELITAPTYVLNGTPIPAAGPLREQWIKDRWSRAGCRPNAAPRGQFVWIAGDTTVADGVATIVDRAKGRDAGRWRLIEAPLTPTGPNFKIADIGNGALTGNKLSYVRGATKIIAAGAIAVTASDYFFAVDTEAAAASDDLDNITGGTQGQRILLRASVTGRVVNLTAAGNLRMLTSHPLSATNQFVELVWDSVAGLWWPINVGVTNAARLFLSATDKILGRATAGGGPAEEITCTAAGRALLAGADAAAQRTTLSVIGSGAAGNGTQSIGDSTAATTLRVVTDNGSSPAFVLRRADNSQVSLTWNGSNGILAASAGGGIDINGDTIRLRSQAAATRVTVDSAGVNGAGRIVSTGAGGVGYAAGAGGAVVQATSKATGVILDKPTGKITTHNAALAAGALVTFTVTNSEVAVTDTINVNLVSGQATVGTYRYWVEKVAAGSFQLTIENRSAGSLSEALVFNFAILKGAIA